MLPAVMLWRAVAADDPGSQADSDESDVSFTDWLTATPMNSFLAGVLAGTLAFTVYLSILRYTTRAEDMVPQERSCPVRVLSSKPNRQERGYIGDKDSVNLNSEQRYGSSPDLYRPSPPPPYQLEEPRQAASTYPRGILSLVHSRQTSETNVPIQNPGRVTFGPNTAHSSRDDVYSSSQQSYQSNPSFLLGTQTPERVTPDPSSAPPSRDDVHSSSQRSYQSSPGRFLDTETSRRVNFDETRPLQSGEEVHPSSQVSYKSSPLSGTQTPERGGFGSTTPLSSRDKVYPSSQVSYQPSPLPGTQTPERVGFGPTAPLPSRDKIYPSSQVSYQSSFLPHTQTPDREDFGKTTPLSSRDKVYPSSQVSYKSSPLPDTQTPERGGFGPTTPLPSRDKIYPSSQVSYTSSTLSGTETPKRVGFGPTAPLSSRDKVYPSSQVSYQPSPLPGTQTPERVGFGPTAPLPSRDKVYPSSQVSYQPSPGRLLGTSGQPSASHSDSNSRHNGIADQTSDRGYSGAEERIIAVRVSDQEQPPSQYNVNDVNRRINTLKNFLSFLFRGRRHGPNNRQDISYATSSTPQSRDDTQLFQTLSLKEDIQQIQEHSQSVSGYSPGQQDQLHPTDQSDYSSREHHSNDEARIILLEDSSLPKPSEGYMHSEPSYRDMATDPGFLCDPSSKWTEVPGYGLRKNVPGVSRQEMYRPHQAPASPYMDDLEPNQPCSQPCSSQATARCRQDTLSREHPQYRSMHSTAKHRELDCFGSAAARTNRQSHITFSVPQNNDELPRQHCKTRAKCRTSAPHSSQLIQDAGGLSQRVGVGHLYPGSFFSHLPPRTRPSSRSFRYNKDMRETSCEKQCAQDRRSRCFRGSPSRNRYQSIFGSIPEFQGETENCECEIRQRECSLYPFSECRESERELKLMAPQQAKNKPNMTCLKVDEDKSQPYRDEESCTGCVSRRRMPYSDRDIPQCRTSSGMGKLASESNRAGDTSWRSTMTKYSELSRLPKVYKTSGRDILAEQQSESIQDDRQQECLPTFERFGRNRSLSPNPRSTRHGNYSGSNSEQLSAPMQDYFFVRRPCRNQVASLNVENKTESSSHDSVSQSRERRTRSSVASQTKPNSDSRRQSITGKKRKLIQGITEKSILTTSPSSKANECNSHQHSELTSTEASAEETTVSSSWTRENDDPQSSDIVSVLHDRQSASLDRPLARLDVGARKGERQPRASSEGKMRKIRRNPDRSLITVNQSLSSRQRADRVTQSSCSPTNTSARGVTSVLQSFKDVNRLPKSMASARSGCSSKATLNGIPLQGTTEKGGTGKDGTKTRSKRQIRESAREKFGDSANALSQLSSGDDYLEGQISTDRRHDSNVKQSVNQQRIKFGQCSAACNIRQKCPTFSLHGLGKEEILRNDNQIGSPDGRIYRESNSRREREKVRSKAESKNKFFNLKGCANELKSLIKSTINDMQKYDRTMAVYDNQSLADEVTKHSCAAHYMGSKTKGNVSNGFSCKHGAEEGSAIHQTDADYEKVQCHDDIKSKKQLKRKIKKNKWRNTVSEASFSSLSLCRYKTIILHKNGKTAGSRKGTIQRTLEHAQRGQILANPKYTALTLRRKLNETSTQQLSQSPQHTSLVHQSDRSSKCFLHNAAEESSVRHNHDVLTTPAHHNILPEQLLDPEWKNQGSDFILFCLPERVTDYGKTTQPQCLHYLGANDTTHQHPSQLNSHIVHDDLVEPNKIRRSLSNTPSNRRNHTSSLEEEDKITLLRRHWWQEINTRINQDQVDTEYEESCHKAAEPRKQENHCLKSSSKRGGKNRMAGQRSEAETQMYESKAANVVSRQERPSRETQITCTTKRPTTNVTINDMDSQICPFTGTECQAQQMSKPDQTYPITKKRKTDKRTKHQCDGKDKGPKINVQNGKKNNYLHKKHKLMRKLKKYLWHDKDIKLWREEIRSALSSEMGRHQKMPVGDHEMVKLAAMTTDSSSGQSKGRNNNVYTMEADCTSETFEASSSKTSSQLASMHSLFAYLLPQQTRVTSQKPSGNNHSIHPYILRPHASSSNCTISAVSCRTVAFSNDSGSTEDSTCDLPPDLYSHSTNVIVTPTPGDVPECRENHKHKAQLPKRAHTDLYKDRAYHSSKGCPDLSPFGKRSREYDYQETRIHHNVSSPFNISNSSAKRMRSVVLTKSGDIHELQQFMTGSSAYSPSAASYIIHWNGPTISLSTATNTSPPEFESSDTFYLPDDLGHLISKLCLSSPKQDVKGPRNKPLSSGNIFVKNKYQKSPTKNNPYLRNLPCGRDSYQKSSRYSKPTKTSQKVKSWTQMSDRSNFTSGGPQKSISCCTMDVNNKSPSDYLPKSVDHKSTRISQSQSQTPRGRRKGKQNSHRSPPSVLFDSEQISYMKIVPKNDIFKGLRLSHLNNTAFPRRHDTTRQEKHLLKEAALHNRSFYYFRTSTSSSVSSSSSDYHRVYAVIATTSSSLSSGYRQFRAQARARRHGHRLQSYSTSSYTSVLSASRFGDSHDIRSPSTLSTMRQRAKFKPRVIQSSKPNDTRENSFHLLKDRRISRQKYKCDEMYWVPTSASPKKKKKCKRLRDTALNFQLVPPYCQEAITNGPTSLISSSPTKLESSCLYIGDSHKRQRFHRLEGALVQDTSSKREKMDKEVSCHIVDTTNQTTSRTEKESQVSPIILTGPDQDKRDLGQQGQNTVPCEQIPVCSGNLGPADSKQPEMVDVNAEHSLLLGTDEQCYIGNKKSHMFGRSIETAMTKEPGNSSKLQITNQKHEIIYSMDGVHNKRSDGKADKPARKSDPGSNIIAKFEEGDLRKDIFPKEHLVPGELLVERVALERKARRPGKGRTYDENTIECVTDKNNETQDRNFFSRTHGHSELQYEKVKKQQNENREHGQLENHSGAFNDFSCDRVTKRYSEELADNFQGNETDYQRNKRISSLLKSVNDHRREHSTKCPAEEERDNGWKLEDTEQMTIHRVSEDMDGKERKGAKRTGLEGNGFTNIALISEGRRAKKIGEENINSKLPDNAHGQRPLQKTQPVLDNDDVDNKRRDKIIPVTDLDRTSTNPSPNQDDCTVYPRRRLKRKINTGQLEQKYGDRDERIEKGADNKIGRNRVTTFVKQNRELKTKPGRPLDEVQGEIVVNRERINLINISDEHALGRPTGQIHRNEKYNHCQGGVGSNERKRAPPFKTKADFYKRHLYKSGQDKAHEDKKRSFTPELTTHTEDSETYTSSFATENNKVLNNIPVVETVRINKDSDQVPLYRIKDRDRKKAVLLEEKAKPAHVAKKSEQRTDTQRKLISKAEHGNNNDHTQASVTTDTLTGYQRKGKESAKISAVGIARESSNTFGLEYYHTDKDTKRGKENFDATLDYGDKHNHRNIKAEDNRKKEQRSCRLYHHDDHETWLDLKSTSTLSSMGQTNRKANELRLPESSPQRHDKHSDTSNVHSVVGKPHKTARSNDMWIKFDFRDLIEALQNINVPQIDKDSHFSRHAGEEQTLIHPVDNTSKAQVVETAHNHNKSTETQTDQTGHPSTYLYGGVLKENGKEENYFLFSKAAAGMHNHRSISPEPNDQTTNFKTAPKTKDESSLVKFSVTDMKTAVPRTEFHQQMALASWKKTSSSVQEQIPSGETFHVQDPVDNSGLVKCNMHAYSKAKHPQKKFGTGSDSPRDLPDVHLPLKSAKNMISSPRHQRSSTLKKASPQQMMVTRGQRLRSNSSCSRHPMFVSRIPVRIRSRLGRQMLQRKKSKLPCPKTTHSSVASRKAVRTLQLPKTVQGTPDADWSKRKVLQQRGIEASTSPLYSDRSCQACHPMMTCTGECVIIGVPPFQLSPGGKRSSKTTSCSSDQYFHLGIDVIKPKSPDVQASCAHSYRSKTTAFNGGSNSPSDTVPQLRYPKHSALVNDERHPHRSDDEHLICTGDVKKLEVRSPQGYVIRYNLCEPEQNKPQESTGIRPQTAARTNLKSRPNVSFKTHLDTNFETTTPVNNRTLKSEQRFHGEKEEKSHRTTKRPLGILQKEQSRATTLFTKRPDQQKNVTFMSSSKRQSASTEIKQTVNRPNKSLGMSHKSTADTSQKAGNVLNLLTESVASKSEKQFRSTMAFPFTVHRPDAFQSKYFVEKTNISNISENKKIRNKYVNDDVSSKMRFIERHNHTPIKQSNVFKRSQGPPLLRTSMRPQARTLKLGKMFETQQTKNTKNRAECRDADRRKKDSLPWSKQGVVGKMTTLNMAKGENRKEKELGAARETLPIQKPELKRERASPSSFQTKHIVWPWDSYATDASASDKDAISHNNQRLCCPPRPHQPGWNMTGSSHNLRPAAVTKHWNRTTNKRILNNKVRNLLSSLDKDVRGADFLNSCDIMKTSSELSFLSTLHLDTSDDVSASLVFGNKTSPGGVQESCV